MAKSVGIGVVLSFGDQIPEVYAIQRGFVGVINWVIVSIRNTDAVLLSGTEIRPMGSLVLSIIPIIGVRCVPTVAVSNPNSDDSYPCVWVPTPCLDAQQANFISSCCSAGCFANSFQCSSIPPFDGLKVGACFDPGQLAIIDVNLPSLESPALRRKWGR